MRSALRLRPAYTGAGALPFVALLASMACAGASTPAASSPGASPSPTLSPVALSTTAPRKIEVLFLGHESQHHNSNKYAPILAQGLAKDGINFSYTTDPNDLNTQNLAKYDAVLLYANHDSATPAQAKALLDYVQSGHGFVPVHSA